MEFANEPRDEIRLAEGIADVHVVVLESDVESRVALSVFWMLSQVGFEMRIAGEAAGQQRVARRSANGGRHMRIIEAHPFTGQSIDVRGEDLSTVASEFLLHLIVGDEENNVRARRAVDVDRQNGERQERKVLHTSCSKLRML